MRVFIAIDIDKQIRAGLNRLQRELISKTNFGKSDVKWVEPDNIHLTLKFLGEIKDEQVVNVCNIVKDVAELHQSFELAVESVGCFGGRSAKVLWVGLGEGSNNLLQLQKDLDEQLALADWPPEEREFTGHLTLCRVKNPKAGFELVEIIKDFKDFKLGDMSVDSVRVYQSQLTPSGPIYTVLGEYKLS
jgi:2'-5' RNA ligase